jgi:hypothetical protein
VARHGRPGVAPYGTLLQLTYVLEVGGDVVEDNQVGCSGRANGRASDPDPPAVLVDHHERAKTSTAGGHWRRRCGGETTVVEDGDDRAEQWMWIWIRVFWQSSLSGFFNCVSWWERVAKENQRSGMLDEKKTDGMLERWKMEQLRSF